MGAVKPLGGPLDSVSRVARPYPSYLLPEGGTALGLFAAAFLGHNDVIHFARKRMRATCVDVDADRLAEMRVRYPADWMFAQADAWTFAEQALDQGELWDVVSVDTFLGDATERSLRSLDLWTSVASKLVTATIASGQSAAAPDGWAASWYPRTDDVFWLVLTRD